ncbi:MAG: AAA family ATPase [Gammaproteobacteria bacterium]
MYEAHFGLRGRPFDTGIAQEVDVFRGTRQSTIIDKAKLALAASDSVATFSGPPGIGKTTLALAAIRSISTRLALARLSSMPTNANEMLELLLVELGINAHRASRIERVQMWRQYLEEMSATDTRVFVVAERTEELAPEVLRALDAVTGADASGSPGANVVLLGHQGLAGFLGSPSLESLRQRIRLRQRLEPFSAAELTEYLRHRVTRVGGTFDKLFAPGAAAAVYRVTGGVARLANTLCEAALTAAAATNTLALTPELITQVAVDMFGDEEVVAPPTPQATPAEAPVPPVAVTKTNTVTIASVAIDITPVKTATVVTAPKTASAAPRAADLPVAPAPLATPAPQPSTATDPTAAAPVAMAPAPVVAQPVAPVAQAAPPTATVAVPMTPPPAPAPVVAASPVPPPVVMQTAPMAAPRPAPTPTAAIAPPQNAALTKPAAPRPALPDFDATATDIPDVSSFDFPVLTDAVEDIVPRTRAPLPAAPVAKTIVTPPAAARATAAPAPRRATPPPPRAEATAPLPPFRRLLEPKAPLPSAPPPVPAADMEEDSDQLHQTQTMRAISMAKSIDDVSDSMAETLFGEADLDFLSAALASSSGESEESEAFAPEASTPPQAAPPEDDLMDLFNLGPDAPLELIDDSSAPPSDRRKSATRRGG